MAGVGQPGQHQRDGGRDGLRWVISGSRTGSGRPGRPTSPISFASFQFTNSGAYNVVVTEFPGPGHQPARLFDRDERPADRVG